MRLEDALQISEHFASRLERPVRPSVAVAGLGKAFAVAVASAPSLPAPRVSLGAAVGQGPLGWRVAVRAWTTRDLALARATLEAVERESRRELQIMLTGPVRAQVAPPPARLQRRRRPLRPGYSVGHYLVSAGTLGCFVRDTIGDLCILSNRHVLADTNDAFQDDPILQMGAADGGTVERHAVAGLRALIELEPRRNVVDAAIAAVYDDLLPADPSLPGIGRLAKGTPRLPNGQVQKVGRTTGHTWGQVTAIGAMSIPMSYGDEGVLRFDNVIEVQTPPGAPPFSAGGDSGSLVVDEDRHPIGLLFGGNDRVTYLNPIGEVLEALDLRLVS